VTDANILRKAFFTKTVFSLEIVGGKAGVDNEVKNLRDFVGAADLANAILLIRDGSARALTEAIVAALTGGTATAVELSGKAAVGMTKAALSDPNTYLQAVTRDIILRSIQRIESAKARADAASGKPWDYQAAEAIYQDLVYGKSYGPPAKVLLAQLILAKGGQGDLASQLGKITESMVTQVLGTVPPGEAKPFITTAKLGVNLTRFLETQVPEFLRYRQIVATLVWDSQFERTPYFSGVVRPRIDYIQALGRR